MALSSGPSNALFICGEMALLTRQFNEQSNIDQVHEYVRQSFSSSLPNRYRILYYDTTTMSFIDLEDQLQNGLNPFQLNSSTSIESTTSTPPSLYFFVVNNSSIHSDTHSSTEIQRDQIVFDSTDDSSLIGEHNESNLSVPSNATNTDVPQDDNEYLSKTNEDQPSTTVSNLIESQDKRHTSSKRLSFSLDVKPNQRDIYKSDQFSIRKKDLNGRIACIQGIKTEQQKMRQVLPRLRIPSIYRQSNVTLLVAVVSEQSKNGMRIWYKHPDKGFLPKGYNKNTEPINPIEFNLNECTFADNDNLLLNLQMITKWNKSQKEREEFYRFDEKKVTRLHPAAHDEGSPRLLCVLRRDGNEIWETFCLSDFIRPVKLPKKRSASVTKSRSRSPKRIKIND